MSEELRESNSTLIRLRAALPQLGPSERRVIQAIIDDPAGIVETSTSDLASLASCSPATVIRACQNVGFRGYQHLRIELAKGPLDQISDEGHVLDEIFREAADALSASQQLLSPEDFDAAVETLLDADRILVAASGFSLPPTQDAAIRFTTMGLTVMAPIDIFAQQFAAKQLTSRDVVLAVSYSGANVHTLRTASSAKENGGAKVLAITSFAQSPVTKIADVSLITGPVGRNNDIDPHLSRISHSLLLYALYRGMLLKQLDSPERMTEMREVIADALSDELN